jgi:membrane fusion protein (multidrug efflux system)
MNKKYIILGFVGLLLILFTLKKCHSGKVKDHVDKNMIELNNADVAKVKIENFDEMIPITGDLNPRNQTIISSEVTAKVLQILVDEGQEVKKGQVLAKLEQDAIMQSVFAQQAATKQAKDTLELQEKIMKQQKELFKENFISELAYAQYENNYSNAKQNFYAQEALLKQSQTNLNHTVIQAPFDGVIVKSNADIGELAMPNSQMFVIADLRKIIIQASVVSDNISRIALGQKAVFTVENDNKNYWGYVERIGQSSQDGTRDFLVYINFDNSKIKLKGGQFIRGNIIVNTIKNAVVIPCTSIGNKQEIFLVNSGKIINMPVKVVVRDQVNNKCVVSAKLSAGTLLVNGNLDNLKPGIKAQLL